MTSAVLDMAHKQLPYYHPELKSMEETRAIMMHYVMKDGAFIVRNSFSQPGKLTVTVMHNHSIKHFSLCSRNGRYMLQDQMFESVRDLVDFYKIHDVPNEEDVKHLRLVHPINRQQPVMIPGSNMRKNACGRSQSVVTAPSFPLASVSPEHRRSVDSSMSEVKWQSNGHGVGAMAPAPGAMPPSSKQLNTPQLPLSIPKKKGGLMRLLKRKPSDSESKASPPKERGPAPLPRLPDTEKDNHYYSIVNPEDVDRHGDLIKHIEQFEQACDGRCECGLTLEEGYLPGGWSMHLSQDDGTNGKLFFMGPNMETVWNLPMEILLQLSVEQQENMRRLIKTNDRFNRCSSSSSGSTGTPIKRLSGNGQVSFGRQATEHECSSDEICPVPSFGL